MAGVSELVLRMPYFEAHLADVHRRVMSAGGDEAQQIAALLHDVLEDSSAIEAELRALGVPDHLPDSA